MVKLLYYPKRYQNSSNGDKFSINSRSGTRSLIIPSKRYEDHSHHFYWGDPQPVMGIKIYLNISDYQRFYFLMLHCKSFSVPVTNYKLLENYVRLYKQRLISHRI